jgi:hypothetical protein
MDMDTAKPANGQGGTANGLQMCAGTPANKAANGTAVCNGNQQRGNTPWDL